MARYIDAAILDEAKFEKPSTAFERGWNAAMAAIFKNAPTIDAVEVGRCKECIHHKEHPRPIPTHVWCERVDGLLPTDWFCGAGARRTDDDRHG